MPQWTLTTAEVQTLLERENSLPWMGSPLLNPEPVPDRGLVSKKLTPEPELRKALLRIARPEIMQGIMQFPPDFSGVHWFYGFSGDMRLAGYGQDQNNRHVLSWPITDQDLMKAMETSLAVQEPAVVEGFVLELSRGGLESLAGIVDLLQEGILKAALERQPPPEFYFEMKELNECLQRGSQGLDVRWMVQSAACLAPLPFQKDPASLENGLQELIKQQMLIQNRESYRPVPRLHAACSLLSGGGGLCALHTRSLVTQAEKPSAWESQHIAAFRGIGSLWLFEFSDITTEDFTVKIGDVTAGLLHERLAAGFRAPIKRVERKPETREPEKQKVCSKCGASLRPAAKFCTQCGGQIVSSNEESNDSGHLLAICPSCGAKMKVGTGFCTQCGAPFFRDFNPS